MDTTPRGRIISLDALRGFVVLVMIFVNDVASVSGLPRWLHHIPPGASGLTFADVVYPAFLFMVGAAIPLAIERRLQEGRPAGEVATHVALRGLALNVIGLLQMNGRDLAPSSPVPYAVWNAAVLVAVILAWAHDPDAAGRRAGVLRVLRVVSIVVLVVLVALYRSKYGGWLQIGNRGILGAIGAAYVVAAGLHGWTRRAPVALFGAFAALVLWNVGIRVGFTPLPIIGNGAAASVAVAGVVTARMLLAREPLVARLAGLAGFAAGMALGGAALAPHFGVAKLKATPSWCLYSAAVTVVLLIFFYVAIDIRGWTAWARPLLPAGRNALLIYLLPDVFYAVFGVEWLDAWLGHGVLGLMRAAVFALATLALGAYLARQRIRMQV